MCQQDEQIVQQLLDHAKGQLCSRYVLGLERAIESIKEGSPKNALNEQHTWAINIKEAKRRRMEKRKQK